MYKYKHLNITLSLNFPRRSREFYVFFFAGEGKIFKKQGFAQFFKPFILFLWGFMAILAVHLDDSYLDGNRLQTLMVYFSYTIASGSLTLCM